MLWPHNVIGTDKFFSMRQAWLGHRLSEGKEGYFLSRVVTVRGGRKAGINEKD